MPDGRLENYARPDPSATDPEDYKLLLVTLETQLGHDRANDLIQRNRQLVSLLMGQGDCGEGTIRLVSEALLGTSS